MDTFSVSSRKIYPKKISKPSSVQSIQHLNGNGSTTPDAKLTAPITAAPVTSKSPHPPHPNYTGPSRLFQPRKQKSQNGGDGGGDRYTHRVSSVCRARSGGAHPLSRFIDFPKGVVLWRALAGAAAPM